MIRPLFFVLALTNPVGLATAMVLKIPATGSRPSLKSTDFEKIYSASPDNDADFSDWIAIEERFGDVHYELHLVVNKHIFITAFPTPSSHDYLSDATECPILAFEDAGALGNSVSVYHGCESDSLKSFTFYLDTKAKLSDIVTAFDNADSSSGSNYSIVKNNCATFILSMLYRGLIPGRPTPEFVDYVTDSLVATGSVRKIRRSPDVGELGATDAMKSNASTLTRALVERYIVKFFHEM